MTNKSSEAQLTPKQSNTENPYSKEAISLYLEELKNKPELDQRFILARSTEELRDRIIGIAKAMVFSEDVKHRQSLFEILSDLVPSSEDMDEGLR